MNLFCRDHEGRYMSAHPEQIINLAQSIISGRLQRSEDIVATSPQDVQRYLATAIGYPGTGNIRSNVPRHQA